MFFFRNLQFHNFAIDRNEIVWVEKINQKTEWKGTDYTPH